MILIDGMVKASQGKVAAFHERLDRAVAAAQKAGQPEFAAQIPVLEAAFDLELGIGAETARRKLAAGNAAPSDRDVRSSVMVVSAQVGEAARAEKLADDLSRQYPRNLYINQGWIPVARAWTAIHKNQPLEAVHALEAVAPYELGAPPGGFDEWPMYLRGKAYLQAKDGAKAAVEFQKVLDHRGIDPATPLNPLSQLGLARAWAMQGDSSKARTGYQDVLALWKDADPDFPMLKEAKAEYAKLQ